MTDLLPFPPYAYVRACMRARTIRGTGKKPSSVIQSRSYTTFSQINLGIEPMTDLSSQPIRRRKPGVDLTRPLVGQVVGVVLDHLARLPAEDVLDGVLAGARAQQLVRGRPPVPV